VGGTRAPVYAAQPPWAMVLARCTLGRPCFLLNTKKQYYSNALPASGSTIGSFVTHP
jgi:hypothetical protein